jgi:hypothetical protein
MKKVIWIVVVIVAVAVLAYALSPLLRNKEINEKLPSSITMDHLSSEEKAQMEEAMKEANSGEPQTANEEMPTTSDPEETYEVVETAGHPAEGEVRIVRSDGKTYVRFENFSTINGPNLHIYLAKDLEANEFVDLGPIKANKGNINYEVPAGVDISEYKYVMHWCVPFRILFNYAEITNNL